MKRFLLACAVAAVATTPLSAAPGDQRSAEAMAAEVDFSAEADLGPVDPERLEAARQFLSVPALQEQVSPVQWMGYFNAGPEEPTAADLWLASELKKVEPGFRSRVPAVLDAYFEAYAREFTADELRELTRFASSDAGRHFLAKNMEVQYSDAIMELERDLFAEIEPLMEEYYRRDCAEQAEQRLAAGDLNAKCSMG